MMNIDRTQSNNTISYKKQIPLKNSKQLAFKGVGSALTKAVNASFKFLADEPVWGATIIDVGSMVIPRTAIDGKKRGFNAGFETGFRESESSANDAAIGLYGVGAGTLIAGAINKKHDVKAHTIFASDDATNVYSEKWIKHNGNIDNYTRDIVDNIEAFNPNSSNADARGYVKIAEEHKQGIIDDLKYIAEGDRTKMPDRWKTARDRLSAKLLEATGVEDGFRLVDKNGAVQKATVSNSKTLMDNFYHLTKAFKSDKVTDKVPELIKDYKKFAKSRTILGIATAALFAVIAQPLNVYLSKKRTGSDGFVGVEGGKKDTSKEFKALKLASSLGMIGISLASMGALSKNPLKIPKLFIEKNQYKGKNPTINHFKTVFGLAIASRLLTARSRDEFREVNVKDVFGFFNWLILGSVFNKLILYKFQAKGANLLKFAPKGTNNGFIYNHIGKTGRKVYDFLTSSIATHSEVISAGLKKERPDIKSMVKPDGKVMKFSEMYKLLPKGGATRKNLRLLNIAQFGGYLYSGLMLGIGIPHLNIYITNKRDEHKKAKLEALKQAAKPIAPVLSEMKQVNKKMDKTVFGQFKRDVEY